MTTTETYGCDRHGEDDAYQGCALCELESLRSRLAEETAIVDRIWDIYGRPTYEQLAGRSIYDLINADRARLAEAETLLDEASPRQECDGCGREFRWHQMFVEEGDRWECAECWDRCEKAERAAMRDRHDDK